MSTSYSNLGGTGNRSVLITVTTTVGHNGDQSILVNGAIDNSFYFYPNAQAVAGLYVMFAFYGSVVIDEAKWYQDSTYTHGDWKWQGSNDASSWTDIGASFTLGGATPFQTQTELSGNTTGYRYYRLLGVSGASSNGPYIQETEFKIDAGGGGGGGGGGSYTFVA
jgi:hypothetical protein